MRHYPTVHTAILVRPSKDECPYQALGTWPSMYAFRQRKRALALRITMIIWVTQIDILKR